MPKASAMQAMVEAVPMTPQVDQLHRRNVRRGRRHELRGHGLVAAADQHRRIHWLRGQHRLGVDRGEVAVVHRSREQRRLAQRYGRESQRQTAGGEDAPLHRLDQFRHGAVAIVVVRAGVDDPHHGLVEHRLGIAHGFGEGLAQIQREVAVAVVGGVAGEASLGGVAGHDALMISAMSEAGANVPWSLPNAPRGEVFGPGHWHSNPHVGR
jgi:hypothetical protein